MELESACTEVEPVALDADDVVAATLGATPLAPTLIELVPVLDAVCEGALD